MFVSCLATYLILFFYSLAEKARKIPSSETQGQLLGRNEKNKPGRNRSDAVHENFLPGLFLRFAPRTDPGSPRMEKYVNLLRKN